MVVYGDAYLERIQLAGIEVLVNPNYLQYSYVTNTNMIMTQGGIVTEMGPEKPIGLAWKGVTSKRTKATLDRVYAIWKSQQKNGSDIRFLNPEKGEDYQVVIKDFTYTLESKSPYRYEYNINLNIVKDNSKLTFGTLSQAMGSITFSDVDKYMSATQNHTIVEGESWNDISQQYFGTAAFAGDVRNNASNNAVTSTGDPVPGAQVSIPDISEANYSSTDVSLYFPSTIQQQAADSVKQQLDQGYKDIQPDSKKASK